MPESQIRTVAVFNASDDTVEMIKVLLSERGYRAISGEVDHVKSGELNFVQFMETHKPDAIVWDIAPPYDRNWNFFQLLRTAGPLAHCPVVLTTTHKEHLDSLAGQDTGAIEIVGKPYDLQVIADAVARAIEAAGSGPRRFGSRN
jgi:CheY-like chemotaxis protein